MKTKLRIDVAKVREEQGAVLTESPDGAKAKLVRFPLRKPGSRDFFRVHLDPDYRIELPVIEDSERQLYFFQNTFQPSHEIHRFVKPVTILTCTTLKAATFLWPIKHSHNDWYSSAIEIGKTAIEKWVRVIPRMDAGSYAVEMGPSELDSVEPSWPQMSFEDLLNNAFEGRIIDNDNHGVVRELTGKV
jgi:hypothetical protein